MSERGLLSLHTKRISLPVCSIVGRSQLSNKDRHLLPEPMLEFRDLLPGFNRLDWISMPVYDRIHWYVHLYICAEKGQFKFRWSFWPYHLENTKSVMRPGGISALLRRNWLPVRILVVSYTYPMFISHVHRAYNYI